MEQWLKCQYLEPKRGERVTGQVQQINSGGFTVRIEESGIDGYVDLRKHPQKFSFNPQQLTLTSKQGLSFQLEQTVDVMIGEIDASARSIQFTLPPEPAATDA